MFRLWKLHNSSVVCALSASLSTFGIKLKNFYFLKNLYQTFRSTVLVTAYPVQISRHIIRKEACAGHYHRRRYMGKAFSCCVFKCLINFSFLLPVTLYFRTVQEVCFLSSLMLTSLAHLELEINIINVQLISNILISDSVCYYKTLLHFSASSKLCLVFMVIFQVLLSYQKTGVVIFS